MTDMQANWRPIPSCHSYQASAEGHIRNRHGKLLSENLSVAGYMRVVLSAPEGSLNRSVHRLVCEAFHGAPPTPSHQVAHGDGNRTNNRWDNLRWATAKENCADRLKHGTHPSGELNGHARLSADQVAEIRSAYKNQKGAKYIKRGTRARLAKKFAVSIGAIKDVASGRSWGGPR